MSDNIASTNSDDSTSDGNLLDVRGLKVHYATTKRLPFQKSEAPVRAVDGVDLSVARGETLGIVGESGSGKSTTGKAILQLTQLTAGSVSFANMELTNMDKEGMRQMRRRMQMIFQDPYSSLNPRMTVGDIVVEPYIVHNLANRRARAEHLKELFELVGLDPNYASRYPHEFSGGQRQRVGIARALAVRPELIVADEPVSSLDVSIQAQIINLLLALQQQFGFTYLFIAHDLAVIRHISDRVAVMYLGKIVELAASLEIYSDPLHPYTIGLLSAVPVPDPVAEMKRERTVIYGDVPSPRHPPPGCRFHTRCWKAQEICSEVEPELVEHSPNHWAACHFPGA